MAIKPETRVVRKIVKALNRRCSGFYFNVHGNQFQKKGISDILGVCKGRFVAIEVKLPDKLDTVSNAQQRFLRDIKRYGGIGLVATTPDEAVAGVLKELGGKDGLRTTIRLSRRTRKR